MMRSVAFCSNGGESGPPPGCRRNRRLLRRPFVSTWIAALALLPLFVGGLLGCTANNFAAPPQIDADVVELFGGEQSVGVVQSSAQVRAYRLPRETRHQPVLADYDFDEKPLDVPAESADALQTVLLDADTYIWDRNKSCEPSYGVRLEFISKQDAVNVLLCLECNILAVYHNGKEVGYQDFDDGAARILAIVKSLYPDDEEIQSLR